MRNEPKVSHAAVFAPVPPTGPVAQRRRCGGAITEVILGKSKNENDTFVTECKAEFLGPQTDAQNFWEPRDERLERRRQQALDVRLV